MLGGEGAEASSSPLSPGNGSEGEGATCGSRAVPTSLHTAAGGTKGPFLRPVGVQHAMEMGSLLVLEAHTQVCP